MRSIGLAALSVIAAAASAVMSTTPARTDSVDPLDRLFVSSSASADQPGCGTISLVDLTTGRRLVSGEQTPDHGRITVRGDGRLGLGVSNWNRPHVVSTLELLDPVSFRWGRHLTAMRVDHGGPVAITPDDASVLIAKAGGSLERHALAEREGKVFGPAKAAFKGATVAEIEFLSDSQAVLLDTSGEMHFVDIDSLRPTRPSAVFQPIAGGQERRLRNTHASISPSGDHLVVGTDSGHIGITDLATHAHVRVPAPGLLKTLDVEFNYSSGRTEYLAVSSLGAVAVYEFLETDDLPELRLIDTARVPRQTYSDRTVQLGGDRGATLAWTGRGDAVVVAIGGHNEFRVLDFDPDSQSPLSIRYDIDVCEADAERFQGSGHDVVSLNRRVKPTATPTVTALQTTTTTHTPTTETTPTATATVEDTATATATATSTQTAIPVPGPIYVPLALRERCVPGKMNADVALVIDASTSMRDGRTQAGRTKLTAAVDAAKGFVGAMSLPHDQAAVVVFNEEARVLQGLTGRRADVSAALREIPEHVRQQTRVDLGIEAGHLELVGTNRNPQNRPVMIVLTDGLANPVPASVAVSKAQVARGDSITIFTIGLGRDHELNVAELREMASKPDYYFHAPDGEDLLAIYDEIAAEIPCPSDSFWGRR